MSTWTPALVPPPAASRSAGSPPAADELLRRIGPACAMAVDPLEIAARLESEGINDAAAKKYGQPDVFALAEDLFVRVPRARCTAAAASNPWRSRAASHLLRGALFGLPGVCYVAASRSLADPAAMVVVVLSLLLSWAFSEALSSVGHHWLGRLDRASGARALRVGLAAGLAVIVPVVVAAGAALHVGPLATGFAVGQAAYLLAATAVLTLGADRWLLAALAPGVVGSLYGAVLADGAIEVVWPATAATVLATLAVAVAATARQGVPKGSVLPRAALRAAGQNAAFGLLAGALLTFTALYATTGLPGSAPAVTMTALPLSLTMGVAELALYRYRSRTFRMLQEATALGGFADASRVLLATVVGGYVALLAAVALALSLVAHLAGSDAMGPCAIGTAVALGGALFVSLLLRSCGQLPAVLRAFAAALCAEVAVLGAGFAAGLHPDVQVVQLVICVSLFAAVAGHGFVALARAANHR